MTALPNVPLTDFWKRTLGLPLRELGLLEAAHPAGEAPPPPPSSPRPPRLTYKWLAKPFPLKT